MQVSEGKTEGSSGNREAVMEANNLSYKFDDILNVSVNRTMKKQYFDTRSYTMPGASQAVSTWNSGVDLIDVTNSYLKFTVRANGDRTDMGFGVGTAMNLIREVKILSSSGIEMARTQDANIYHKFVSKSKYSANWHTTVGALMGNGVTTVDTADLTVCIPLCELDPFFKLYDGKLLPANVASGLRVEITWADLAQAFISGGAGGTTTATAYTVSQIEFRTESVTLADSAMAVLNKEASTNGLEITYDRVYTTSKNTGTALDDNIEIRKAVSLAKSAFCVTIPTTQTILIDSFLAAAYTFTSADFRLGNQYYPFQPIENVSEGYFNYLRGHNKLKSVHESVTTPVLFSTGGMSNICATFETDDSLNLTGLPLNSSRILECRFVRSAATDVKAYVFLSYTALARASLSNCSVKI
jgi:hypothetical protein